MGFITTLTACFSRDNADAEGCIMAEGDGRGATTSAADILVDWERNAIRKGVCRRLL